MSNEKHTPGPWQYGRCGGDCGVYTAGLKPVEIAHINNIDEDNSCKVMDANAKLISAAPDLLEALNLVFEHAKLIINDNHPDYKKTIAAIKKATE